MIDTKRFKEVAAQFSGTAVSDPLTTLPDGSTVSLAISGAGVLYVTLTDTDGSVSLKMGVDDAAAPATPVGPFISGIYRATLPSYTDGDATIFHFDSRGRLLVSPGETGLTADIDTDQSAGPATPVGQYIIGKREATLPTYADGDNSAFHFDSRGRLLTIAGNPVTGAVSDIGTEDSAGPANPTGDFSLGLYRASLPAYTDGDAACFHFSANGRLLVSSGGLPGTTSRSDVAGSATSVTILATNASREGATVFNEQPTDGSGETLYLLLEAAVASTTNYTVQMAPNTYYEVPFGYTGEIRGIWGAATGTARVTELT